MIKASDIRPSGQIRQDFLDFFKSKQHTIVPSSSLMPDSPNLLFTNAGMNQFVPIFLGQVRCPYNPPRAADTQKCIRAGGKHNDLDDVGLDTYHHTFFEMLGNWSFGDYFKKEAIDWAWELITEVWKFPKERLYATVFCPHMNMTMWNEELAGAVEFARIRIAGGDAKYGQEVIGGTKGSLAINWPDDESASLWAEHFLKAGLDPMVHIIPGDRKDNFWMMGETGPCGPCSELHVDLTPAGDTKGSLVNKGSPQCIEIWNLVFIQFNANPDGTFSPLPARHVDTGMGFERVTSIIQGTKNFTDFAHAKISNYETDIFRPIFDALEKMSGKKYGSTLPGSVSIQGSVDVAVAASGEHTRPRVLQSAPPPIAGEKPGTAEARYSRRNLPHFERPWAKYMVTFSTAGRHQLSTQERDIVLKSILHAHEHRQVQLYAACVMPDHVHLLFEPQIKEQDKEGKPVFWQLADILQGIKSASAHNINHASGRTGPVWEKESMDRMIRSESDLEEKFQYICRNPWDGGVVPMTENYPWLWTFDGPDSDREGAVGDTRGRVCSPENGTPSLQVKQEQISIDVAFRVIADHIRTLSFAIADGIQPGNTDRNYVLRRILRRAVRYGRTLGFHEPFFYKLVDVLAETMGHVFPEIRAKQKHVKEVIQREEEAFNKTLDKGIGIFEEAIGEFRVKAKANTEVMKNFPGHADLGHSSAYARVEGEEKSIQAIDSNGRIFAYFAFKLYDTYGFPLDLTELMARERGLTVDVAGFNKLMDEQKARARAAQKKEVISLSQIETTTPTDFVGFKNLETSAQVLEIVSINGKAAIVFDTSPFYAEMGGQVGDTGQISLRDDIWPVTNTQKSGNVWLHFVDPGNSPSDDLLVSDVKAGNIPSKYEAQSGPGFFPEVFERVSLSVNKSRRNAIQRHHTVTHLLHWALHEVVSRDASQKGSFVGPDKLTFDFNSPPLTPAQVSDVEKLVNERILENAGVSWTEVPYADVKSRKDVMQFFGDKYGDTVRVVQIGGQAQKLDGYSMELCGGTHTRATGEIGLFRIVGESAIAAGVRRIEAVAGLEAYRKATDELHLIKSLAGRVNSPVHELEKKIESMLAQQKELEKQLKATQQREASNAASELLERVHSFNGVPGIIHNLGAVDGDFLQAVADSLKGRFKGVLVLGGASGGSVALVASVSTDFTAKFQAGKIIQAIAPIVGGKGGGKPDNARGGGKDAGKLEEALAKARSLLG